MQVIKRDGKHERVSYDKIGLRIERLANDASLSKLTHVNTDLVTQLVIGGLYDQVHTTQLDILAAETSAYMSTSHPEYDTLGSRIAISNLQKETSSNFLEVIRNLYNYINPKNGKPSPLVSKALYEIVLKNAEVIQKRIKYERDYDYSFFGFKTLCKSYLLRLDNKIVERPQHLLMRVALGIHGEDLESAFES